MANGEWKVLPHDPIEKLSENLWRVEGALPGMSLRRVMTVARLGDGRLVLHSPVALDEAGMKELEAWGTPAFLLIPNRFHRLDAPAYKRRYPSIRVLAPGAGRKKIEEKVAVDGTFEEFPADPTVRIEPLAGLGGHEAALLVRSADGVSVVLTDCVFNMDMKRDFMGWLITRLMGSAPGPRVSRLFKLVGIKDKPAFRGELERLAATPDLVRLIVAHEKLSRGPAAAADLRKAATFV